MSANGQIRDLEKRLADAEQRAALAEVRAHRVAEYRVLCPGHPLAEHAYIALRTLGGNRWAVVDDVLGGPMVWLGDRWVIASMTPRAVAYRWSLEEAEEHAERLAKLATDVHLEYAARRAAETDGDDTDAEETAEALEAVVR